MARLTMLSRTGRPLLWTLIVMALLRVKRPEQIKSQDPLSLGQVLGLPRSPEVKIHSDGKAAAGIMIEAEGMGTGGSRCYARTAEDGTYRLKLQPNNSYIVAVADDQWAAASLTGIVLRDGENRQDLDFQLSQGTLIHGICRCRQRRPLYARTIRAIGGAGLCRQRGRPSRWPPGRCRGPRRCHRRYRQGSHCPWPAGRCGRPLSGMTVRAHFVPPQTPQLSIQVWAETDREGKYKLSALVPGWQGKMDCDRFPDAEHQLEFFQGPKIVVQSGENNLGDTVCQPANPEPNAPAAERR